ncbi:MAG TPA: radical SAM protein [Candidatus Hydrogenedentes bacterium]|jgi:7-carboxy-7-deazaguanine synthase|nr:radical SAM protein [Candidatus Hydrogenedentota bacterium]HPK00620.1 radical SAM protein [Candidatus Hydrogenedentota bacterium]
MSSPPLPPDDASKHPARPAKASEKTLVVTEIYRSIQGESTWAGRPCTFIRLTGCNLRCVWCDTSYAFKGGTRMTIAEILAECRRLGCALVEITGGEPLLQKACPRLAEALLAEGYTVLCETSGSLPIADLPRDVVKIMDLKCPGSGECEKNDWANLDALGPRDEIKFVIASRADYEWSRDVFRKYNLAARCHAVLFSPVFGAIAPKDIVAWLLEDALDARFQLQLHKFIWPPSQKGV